MRAASRSACRKYAADPRRRFQADGVRGHQACVEAGAAADGEDIGRVGDTVAVKGHVPQVDGAGVGSGEGIDGVPELERDAQGRGHLVPGACRDDPERHSAPREDRSDVAQRAVAADTHDAACAVRQSGLHHACGVGLVTGLDDGGVGSVTLAQDRLQGADELCPPGCVVQLGGVGIDDHEARVGATHDRPL